MNAISLDYLPQRQLDRMITEFLDEDAPEGDLSAAVALWCVKLLR